MFFIDLKKRLYYNYFNLFYINVNSIFKHIIFREIMNINLNIVHDNPPQIPHSHEKCSSLLENAIYSSNKVVLQKLIEASPDLISKPLPKGDLPLVLAVKEKNGDFVELLLKLGASPTQKDDQDLSSIDYALIGKDTEIFAKILHHFVSEDIDSVYALVHNQGSLERIKLTVNQISDNIKNIDQRNLPFLHEAVLQKNCSSVKNYLSQVDCNFKECSNEGNSILHLAVISGNLDILNSCLNHPNASSLINFKNKNGLTALHYAAALKRLDMIQLLSSKGADIRITDIHQTTPLLLLSSDVDQKDPLKVSKAEMLAFVASTILYISELTSYVPPIKDVSWQFHMAVVVSFGALDIIRDWGTFKTWKGYLINLCAGLIVNRFASLNNPVRYIFTILNLHRLATITFNDLTLCWRNASLGQDRALFKAVIANAPRVHLAAQLTRGLLGYFYPSNASTSPSNLEEFYEDYVKCRSMPGGPSPRCLDLAWDKLQLCEADPMSEDCQRAKNLFPIKGLLFSFFN
jgi:ankyrin repeat protein